ncbi:hypothetical protein TWF694_005444 [Orbilia ellipsospora]|uniref:Uncharacterized protein n=1 Tax=Orbilia ellipsospora TaxID=2528407 RepID=A0AAV9WT36_9PEZI
MEFISNSDTKPGVWKIGKYRQAKLRSRQPQSSRNVSNTSNVSASSIDSIVTVHKLTPEQQIETPAQILAKKRIAEHDEQAAVVRNEFQKHQKQFEIQMHKERENKKKRKKEKARRKEKEEREMDYSRTPSPSEDEKGTEIISSSVSLTHPSQEHRRRVVPGMRNSAIRRAKQDKNAKPPARYLPGPEQMTRPTDPHTTVYGPPQLLGKIEYDYGRMKATCPPGRLPKSIIVHMKNVVMERSPIAWALLEAYFSQGSQDKQAKDSIEENIALIFKRFKKKGYRLETMDSNSILEKVEEIIKQVFEEPEPEPHVELNQEQEQKAEHGRKLGDWKWEGEVQF